MTRAEAEVLIDGYIKAREKSSEASMYAGPEPTRAKLDAVMVALEAVKEARERLITALMGQP